MESAGADIGRNADHWMAFRNGTGLLISKDRASQVLGRKIRYFI
jgi:hypothetical protein